MYQSRLQGIKNAVNAVIAQITDLHARSADKLATVTKITATALQAGAQAAWPKSSIYYKDTGELIALVAISASSFYLVHIDPDGTITKFADTATYGAGVRLVRCKHTDGTYHEYLFNAIAATTTRANPYDIATKTIGTAVDLTVSNGYSLIYKYSFTLETVVINDGAGSYKKWVDGAWAAAVQADYDDATNTQQSSALDQNFLMYCASTDNTSQPLPYGGKYGVIKRGAMMYATTYMGNLYLDIITPTKKATAEIPFSQGTTNGSMFTTYWGVLIAIGDDKAIVSGNLSDAINAYLIEL